jgi:hypothetical protein
MKQTNGTNNKHNTRESWLRSATDMMRKHFEDCGYPLPSNIRFAIAFPSTGRRGTRVGECWHADTSEDGNYELIIRADIAEPVEVLGVLVHELVHSVVPVDAGHGKLYRDAAIKIGLTGKMREAMPNGLLRDRLITVAEALGPLPHARLNIERGRDNKGPADRAKKQGTRMLKASCQDENCTFVVRLAATPAREIGSPHCPKHGEMTVEWPENEDTGDSGDDAPEDATPAENPF